jgi:transcriptional regulator with XRE-family HTH domain
VSRYERNLAAPSIDVVKKICEALDVSIDTLIYGQQDEKEKNNLKDSYLLNLFTKVQLLDKQDLTAVKSMLKAYIFQKDYSSKISTMIKAMLCKITFRQFLIIVAVLLVIKIVARLIYNSN